MRAHTFQSFLNFPNFKKSLSLKTCSKFRKSENVLNTKLKWKYIKWGCGKRLLLLICIQKYIEKTGSFKITNPSPVPSHHHASSRMITRSPLRCLMPVKNTPFIIYFSFLKLKKTLKHTHPLMTHPLMFLSN